MLSSRHLFYRCFSTCMKSTQNESYSCIEANIMVVSYYIISNRSQFLDVENIEDPSLRVTECKQNMQDTNIDDRISVYEIGYLVAGSVAEENVSLEAEKVKSIITKAGASVIADELPHLEQLAYTMRVKTVSGSYEKYDKAYFGWIKFELSSSVVESVKKSVELVPTVLRMILLSTTKENTYLGKRASQIAAAIMPKRVMEPGVVIDEKKDVAPISIEDMDKSIDDMVKEVK